MAACALLLVFFLVAAIPLLLWSQVPFWESGITALCTAIVVLYTIDTCFFTTYRLDQDDLVITSQLRHFSFPYRAMVRIQPAGLLGLVSVGRRRRFALSTRCYAISLHDNLWTTITISPANPNQFIEQMLHKIDEERSSRSTVELPGS